MTKIVSQDSCHTPPLVAAIKNVLNQPQRHEWTVQGLGMLRCYPFGSTEFRLNVWHHNFRQTPRASDMHDHPWHFTSWVVAGSMVNTRFIEVDEDMPGERFLYRIINCGVDCGTGEIGRIRLGRHEKEIYRPFSVYNQRAEEIHSTDFNNGTVTLNWRERVHGDRARIFWPEHGEWFAATTRKATFDEIVFGCTEALSFWDWPGQ